ncbi:hypothetical protein [Amycolatopsis alkalitolerans]|uniref:hypothetical protein n=1 Tax=Amycolatopsis alkalitolerans TaxID=2547244 RepID=UPI00389902AE
MTAAHASGGGPAGEADDGAADVLDGAGGVLAGWGAPAHAASTAVRPRAGTIRDFMGS